MGQQDAVGAGGDSGQSEIRLQAPTRVRDLGLPLVSAARTESSAVDACAPSEPGPANAVGWADAAVDYGFA